jgi:hypothetical protein
LAVVALQLALPASMLVVRWLDEGSRPVSELPASFQMYSAEPPVSYTGTDATGRERQLEVGWLPPVLRAVDTGRVLPDRLCDRHPDLRVVRRTGGTQPGTYSC